MKIALRPLPLVPYFVPPVFIPLSSAPPTSTATLTVTAASDVLAGAATFTSTATIAVTAGSDAVAAVAVFTATATYAVTGASDVLASAAVFLESGLQGPPYPTFTSGPSRAVAAGWV